MTARRIAFGLFVTPRAGALGRLRETVRAAEEHGFDHIAVQDHPYQPGLLDAFAVIGTMLGETRRIGFVPNVANLPLRAPALLAKAAAAYDLLSGGRFDLGLGGGGFPAQIAALGGPERSPREAYEAVEEAVTVLRALWDVNGGEAEFTGRHYRLAQAPAGPAPAHGVGIWLGAKGPRMLDLVGRAADGWIAPVSTPFETKAAALRRIDSAATAAGRDPGRIRRIVQLVGAVTDRPETGGRLGRGPGTQPIRTTAHEWAAVAAGFAADGFDTVQFIPQDESTEQAVRFATQVIPAARDAVAAASADR